MKKKNKSSLDLMKEIRGTWCINPRTRVHDNQLKKDKKKQRSQNKTTCREGLNEYGNTRKGAGYNDSVPFSILFAN